MKKTSFVRAAATGLIAMGIAAPAYVTTTAMAETEPQLQRQALLNLSKPVTLDVEDQPLIDLINFVTEVTGAEIEALYEDDYNAFGLDPELEITIKATNMPALAFVERMLAKADSAAGLGSADGYTWQLTEDGVVRIGPRERLNRDRRVEMYDISDLIIEIRDYTEAPEFDLQSVLSSSQGGGGGQSPFSTSNTDIERIPLAERAQAVQDIISAIVEPEQWVSAGGDAASMTFFQGHLIINAPDYVHRQLNGYPFWPSRLTRSRNVDGRRFMEIRADPAVARPRP